MTINLTALQNLEPITFNSTNITDSTEVVNTIVNTTDSVSGGYFGLVVMIGVFIVILFTTNRQEGDIRLDIIKSLTMASGFASIVGIVLLVSGLSSSFVHLMWFISLFMIMTLINYNVGRKN